MKTAGGSSGTVLSTADTIIILFTKWQSTVAKGSSTSKQTFLAGHPTIRLRSTSSGSSDASSSSKFWEYMQVYQDLGVMEK